MELAVTAPHDGGSVRLPAASASWYQPGVALVELE
jgi:hypothetical protein